jgi:hypothetical protein
MKRYRVTIKNAKECQVELSFPDLCVHYSNGFAPVLKVKEGEEIPLSVCDPEDIRKSWLVGSLKGYLENKWIEEIIEDVSPSMLPAQISQFITEQMVLAPKINLIKTEVSKQQEVVQPLPQSNLPDVIKVAEQKPVLVVQNEVITDFNLVKTYEDFNRLSHFLKLRFIKESNNIELLRQIQTLTTSSQFRNNVQLRLSQIKI